MTKSKLTKARKKRFMKLWNSWEDNPEVFWNFISKEIDKAHEGGYQVALMEWLPECKKKIDKAVSSERERIVEAWKDAIHYSSVGKEMLDEKIMRTHLKMILKPKQDK